MAKTTTKREENGSVPSKSEPRGIATTFLPIDALIPYARNSRTHSPEQVAQLAASIVEFGFTNPILADDAGIVAGHGRVLAARQLYDAGKVLRLPGGAQVPAGCVPVIECAGWSDAQRRAYVIADNNLALNAGWDFDVLSVELDELRDLDFDLKVLGFSDKDLADMIGTPADPPNTAPQLSGAFTYGVAIACKDEVEQGEFLQRFEAEGLTCKPLISL